MKKVFERTIDGCQETLHINSDYVCFSFRTESTYECNIQWELGGSIKHSTGSVTSQTITNFNAFQALQRRMELLVNDADGDGTKILEDSVIKQILKNNNWKAIDR